MSSTKIIIIIISSILICAIFCHDNFSSTQPSTRFTVYMRRRIRCLHTNGVNIHFRAVFVYRIDHCTTSIYLLTIYFFRVHTHTPNTIFDCAMNDRFRLCHFMEFVWQYARTFTHFKCYSHCTHAHITNFLYFQTLLTLNDIEIIIHQLRENIRITLRREKIRVLVFFYYFVIESN